MICHDALLRCNRGAELHTITTTYLSRNIVTMTSALGRRVAGRARNERDSWHEDAPDVFFFLVVFGNPDRVRRQESHSGRTRYPDARRSRCSSHRHARASDRGEGCHPGWIGGGSSWTEGRKEAPRGPVHGFRQYVGRCFPTKPASRGDVTLMITHRLCQRTLPALCRSAPLSAGALLPQRPAQQPACPRRRRSAVDAR